MRIKNISSGYFFLSIIFFSKFLIINAQEKTGLYKVNPRVINLKPVSPLIYGNFIELGFGRQIEGMWSEKLFNSSFEVVTPYKPTTWNWLKKSPEDDLTKEPWWHTGYEECLWYSVLSDGKDVPMSYTQRNSGFYHGIQAAIVNNSQSKSRVFMAQDGIWINKSVNCLFKGYMKNNRQGNNSTPVKVTIGLYPQKDFSHPIVEKTVTVNGSFYKEYSVDLSTGIFEGRATFAVSIEAGENVSFDGFSLMPEDNIKGWRKDVINTLKQIHVPIIRFPGGCFASFYNWRTGIGPRVDRKPLESPHWGGIEENNVGTAEFVEMCRIIGAEPFICVNVMTGSSLEAAEWVAYNNSSNGDKMNVLRNKHGYSEPLTVKYWELDNEVYRRFGYEEYANRCVEFSKEMKAVDPKIQLVMVGYGRYMFNLKEMLEIAGPYIDLITDRSLSEIGLKRDLNIIADYNKIHGTNIRLCNTEWLAREPGTGSEVTNPPGRQQNQSGMTLQQKQITWNYAMNAASRLLMFQRLGGDFEFSNFNNLCNTWGQNIIECPKDKAFISAVGKVYELMSRSEAAWILQTDTLKVIDGVFIQTATTADKKELIIYFLNFLNTPQKINIDLSAFSINSKDYIIRSLFAEKAMTSNIWSSPDNIKSDKETISLKNSRKPDFVLKPLSLSEVRMKLRIN